MFSKVLSAAVYGVQSKVVQVETDITNGLPSFSMVGYLSTQVKEAQERVRTALKNSGIQLQPKKITVNLSPADLHKSGTGFDLPIAIAIAASYGLVDRERLEDTFIIGELSLNGKINGVPGILPMAAKARSIQCSRCIVPWQNQKEARAIEGIEVIGAETLEQVLTYLQTGEIPKIEENIQKEAENPKEKPDFYEVHGQDGAKRAALVAAAGFHNLLMIGPPGAGKSMIASRIPGILPSMTEEEAIELSAIYSVIGKLPPNGSLIKERPFRAPHHTITAKALCGGGTIPGPGEISLAHCGVLFLDELPEFHRETLEVLRQPLENGSMQIHRCGYTYDFPAQFMLVGAMNPCPCGFYPDLSRCHCSYTAVRRYQEKISMPLLDRMDMMIEVSALSYPQWNQKTQEMSSTQMRKKVERVREIQKERRKGQSFLFNSRMGNQELEEYCALGTQEKKLMKKAFDELKMSARGYTKILKVARTVADLEEKEQIQTEHLQEALCYRIGNGIYR